MIFKSIYLCAICTCLAVVSFNSNAALLERLGGLAYYDDVADLTWLADANAAVGSVYDTAGPGSGVMSWEDANTWAASLNVTGVTGWRLPDTIQPDASCDGQSVDSSFGYNCTGSELGNLFYNVLGNSAGSLTNVVPFTNVRPSVYWSATIDVSDFVWIFTMFDGFQSILVTDATTYAWAVHSGDVSAVPIPAAAWLFSSGFIGLAGIARRKKA